MRSFEPRRTAVIAFCILIGAVAGRLSGHTALGLAVGIIAGVLVTRRMGLRRAR